MEKEKYVREIESRLRQSGREHFVFWRDIYGCDIRPAYKREYIYWMIRDSYDRKIIIYGADEEGERLRRTLYMLDVEVDFFVDDIENEYEWDGKTVKPVYDLFYVKKEEYKVAVTAAKGRQTEKLKKIGLRERIDYNLCYEYMPNRRTAELYILDPHLGYNFIDGKNPGLAGFTDLGGEKCLYHCSARRFCNRRDCLSVSVLGGSLICQIQRQWLPGKDIERGMCRL